MGLVHEHQVVVGEVVQQRPRGAPLGPLGEVAGVVLHPGAEPGFLQHFDIVVGAAFQPRGLQYLARVPQFPEPPLQFLADPGDRQVELILGGHKVVRRIDGHLRKLGQHLAGQRVELHDALHLIAEELDAHGGFLIRWHQFQHVAAHAEFGAG